MSRDTPIFIPTYRRPAVLTYWNLPQSCRHRVLLVCHPDEEALLQKNHPNASTYLSSTQGQGACYAKQACLDLARDLSLPVCLMLDDDLSFQSSMWADNKKRFRRSTDGQILRALHLLVEKAILSGVGFTSFSTPFMNSAREEWLPNRRMAHSLAINVQNVSNVGASFLGIPTMSDVKFLLECYAAGLESWSLMSHAVVDSSPPGVGGETYDGITSRARRFQEAISYLVERWPDFVRIRPSTNSRHLANIGYPQDITLLCAKAAEWGQRMRKPPSHP